MRRTEHWFVYWLATAHCLRKMPARCLIEVGCERMPRRDWLMRTSILFRTKPESNPLFWRLLPCWLTFCWNLLGTWNHWMPRTFLWTLFMRRLHLSAFCRNRWPRRLQERGRFDSWGRRMSSGCRMYAFDRRSWLMLVAFCEPTLAVRGRGWKSLIDIAPILKWLTD